MCVRFLPKKHFWEFAIIPGVVVGGGCVVTNPEKQTKKSKTLSSNYVLLA